MPNATVPLMVSTPDFGIGSVLKMSGSLFLILALLLFVYYFMRRLNVGGSFPGSRKGKLEIVERLPLGPRQSVAVIKYCDKEIVIGVTQGNITLLHAMGEKNGKNDFAGVLKKEHSGSSDS